MSRHHHAWTFRAPKPGDLGWVVHRHGALYAQEYGWDWRFEAVVARIVADFIDNFDPARERGWIAEEHGGIVGSVFLAKASDDVARLRMLLVEPSARGSGLGTALVGVCVAAAKEIGYKSMTLWTENVLTAARRIYRRAGFTIVSSEPTESFGHQMVSEIWQLDLTAEHAGHAGT